MEPSTWPELKKFHDPPAASIHSSIQLEHDSRVIQVDPWSRGDLSKLKPADLILITDDVNHHLDVKAIAKLRKPNATIVVSRQISRANLKSRIWFTGKPLNLRVLQEVSAL